MRIILIIGLSLLCVHLWNIKHDCNMPEGQAKITVNLVDGKELYPDKTYAFPAHIQIIMTDGRAITMAWSQVESITSK